LCSRNNFQFFSSPIVVPAAAAAAAPLLLLFGVVAVVDNNSTLCFLSFFLLTFPFVLVLLFCVLFGMKTSLSAQSFYSLSLLL
jgi:hypothetical protein